MPIPDTRERILLAAEHLFGEQGFAGTSLRAVTTAAGVNLAAVNYHFRSKEALFQAVAHHCMRPLADERLRRLEALQISGEELTLEALLDAYLAPIFEEIAQAGEPGSDMMRFFVQVLSDPNPQIQQMVYASAHETVTKYLAAFAQVLPHLSPQELTWRFRTLNMVAFHAAATLDASLLARQSLPDAAIPHTDDAAWMRTFLLAALRAPASGTRDQDHDPTH